MNSTYGITPSKENFIEKSLTEHFKLKQHEKIRIVGGIGPESTIAYYRIIIKGFQEELGTQDFPEIMLHSINMTQMLNHVFNMQLEELAKFLMDKIKPLESSGVDFIAIASNTPHIVFEELSKKTPLPIISIVEETCRAIHNLKIQRVALLGTKSTMSAGFYGKVAEQFDIEIVLPNLVQQEFIHEIYMNELVFNKIVPTTKQNLIDIVAEMKAKKSIQGLILGGTELPLILKQSDFNDVHAFDTTKIHVQRIVKEILKN